MTMHHASVDLTTTYLGVELKTPIVASASPITGDPQMWQRLERAGAGAIVLPSLFEEQIEVEGVVREAASNAAMGLSAESSSFYPDLPGLDDGPLRHIERHGPEEITKILDAMQDWMIERGYVGISELRGSVTRSNTLDGEAYERANYYQVVHVPVGSSTLRPESVLADGDASDVERSIKFRVR